LIYPNILKDRKTNIEDIVYKTIGFCNEDCKFDPNRAVSIPRIA
jgi:hypothetical protein